MVQLPMFCELQDSELKQQHQIYVPGASVFSK
jgi:hypothetical protein